MRWLLIHPGPSWSVADVFNGWSEALTGLGETVEEYPLDAALRFFNNALAETGRTLPCGCREVRKYLDRGQASRLALDPILAAASRFWPDVILCTSAFFMQPWLLEILRHHRHKIIMLMTESPYQDDFQLKAAAYADLTLLNDPVNLDAYRRVGPAEYMPQAYRPEVHYPAAPGTEPEYDLAFVGTGFPSRVAFFEAMALALERRPGRAPLRQVGLDLAPHEDERCASRREAGSIAAIAASEPDSPAASRSSPSLPGRFASAGLNVRLAGLWMDLPEDSPLREWTATEADDCVDNHEVAAIYRRSRCGINFYRVESEAAHEGEGVACGPREIEQAACGLWFARDPRPESDELFPMLPSFTSPEEAGDLIRWALAHPEERERAAGEARAAVQGRTFTEHAKKLLRLLSRQPVTM